MWKTQVQPVEAAAAAESSAASAGGKQPLAGARRSNHHWEILSAHPAPGDQLGAQREERSGATEAARRRGGGERHKLRPLADHRGIQTSGAAPTQLQLCELFK